MKNKKWWAVIFCAAFVLAAFIIGYSGVIDLTEKAKQNAESECDRLIGAFITKEPLDLFDEDSFFQNNLPRVINGEDIDEQEMFQYNERLYAANSLDTDHSEVVFEGINGISIYSAYFEVGENGFLASSLDEGCTDFHQAYSSGDEHERLAIEGTIYSSTLTGWECFYVNPMYQTSDGRIYIVPGLGNYFGSEVDPGMSCTQTLSEDKTVALNGEERISEFELKATFTYMDPPDSVIVFQFDDENQLIAQNSFRADIIPQELSPDEAAEYIIIETVSTALDGSKSISRQLIQHEDDFANTFSVRDDGICVKHMISVNWKK